VAVGSLVDDLIDSRQVPSGGGAVAAAPASGGGAAPAADTKEEEKKEEKVRTLISAYGPHLTHCSPRCRKSPTMTWALACSIRLQLYRCNVPNAFASIFRCTLVSG
jgi:hypothetical protein